MRVIKISANEEDFLISIKDDGRYKRGAVYPVHEFEDGSVYYCALLDNSPTENIKEARHFFDFLFCWRGVWEGRVYFKDDEYWGEEMKTIYLLWSKIEEEMKSIIRKERPDITQYE